MEWWLKKWNKKREEYTMKFEVKLQRYWTKGHQTADKPQKGQYQWQLSEDQ